MDTRAAFDVIWNAWQNGQDLDQLPDNLRPTTAEDGYAIQAHFEEMTTHPLYGWKIAATSIAGQTHINVPGPIAGRLLAEHVYPDGGEIPFRHELLAVMEPEFAFRFGQDLPPKPSAYTRDEVLAAVESLHPALELPNTRFRDVTEAGEAQIAAEAACAGTFVLGPAAPESWRNLDLKDHQVTAHINDTERFVGIGSNVLGDPRDALLWLVNKASSLGITLAAGQIVTTGTCLPPPPIKAGDHMRADFGVLGQVSASFSR